MVVLTTGDDNVIACKLTDAGKTFPISNGASVKAVVTSLDRQTTLSAVVEVNLGAVGTDLANSKVIVEFGENESGAITQYGVALLEIQVDDGGKVTWTKEILIRKGNIA